MLTRTQAGETPKVCAGREKHRFFGTRQTPPSTSKGSEVKLDHDESPPGGDSASLKNILAGVKISMTTMKPC